MAALVALRTASGDVLLQQCHRQKRRHQTAKSYCVPRLEFNEPLSFHCGVACKMQEQNGGYSKYQHRDEANLQRANVNVGGKKSVDPFHAAEGRVRLEFVHDDKSHCLQDTSQRWENKCNDERVGSNALAAPKRHRRQLAEQESRNLAIDEVIDERAADELLEKDIAEM